MKMNKKIIVSTLALAMGAALAGSVSGTVAWFQYSTRAQAAYIGTTAHCSEALEIQATAVGADADPDAWKTELLAADVATASAATGTNLTPITSGEVAKNAALPKVVTTPDDPTTNDVDETVYGTDPAFYANPIYQHFAYNEWQKADSSNYVQFDLHLRVRDVNGASTASMLAKDVFLANLSIVSLDYDETNDAYSTSSLDLYKSVRVHLAYGEAGALFANDGANSDVAADINTIVSSKLDLNQDGRIDTTAAYSDWETGEEKFYGGSDATIKQVAYNVNQAGLFANDSDPTLPTANRGTLGKLGSTAADADLKITVTIWFEGWQKLADGVGDSTNDVLWEPSAYIGQHFGVGMRFVVPAHADSTDHPAQQQTNP